MYGEHAFLSFRVRVVFTGENLKSLGIYHENTIVLSSALLDASDPSKGRTSCAMDTNFFHEIVLCCDQTQLAKIL